MATTHSPPQLWPMNGSGGEFYMLENVSVHTSFENEQEQVFALVDEDDDEDEFDTTIIERPAAGSAVRHNISTEDDALSFIQNSDPKTSDNIVLIRQLLSWGGLEISKTAAQALFTHLGVSPSFWEVTRQFCRRQSANQDSFGAFAEWKDEDGSFEISYIAKHTEENHKPAPHVPWSARQIGVLHQFSAPTNHHTIILLNPSKTVEKCLNYISDPWDIHRIVISMVTQQWPKYIAYLEDYCSETSQRAGLANNTGGGGRYRSAHNDATSNTTPAPAPLAGVNSHNNGRPSAGFTVEFADSQRTQWKQVILLRAIRALELNRDTMKRLAGISYLEKYTIGFAALEYQTEDYKNHLENLLRRLDTSSALIRSILDTQAYEMLQNSSALTASIMGLARKEARKSSQDARRLSTITVLGFVYLPASFVATLLSMHYISISGSSTAPAGFSIRFEPEFCIWVVLTAIFLSITGGVAVYLNRQQKRLDDLDIEKAMDEKSQI